MFLESKKKEFSFRISPNCLIFISNISFFDFKKCVQKLSESTNWCLISFKGKSSFCAQKSFKFLKLSANCYQCKKCNNRSSEQSRYFFVKNAPIYFHVCSTKVIGMVKFNTLSFMTHNGYFTGAMFGQRCYLKSLKITNYSCSKLSSQQKLACTSYFVTQVSVQSR